MNFLLVFSMSCMVTGVWLLICNQITYHQRVKLIHRCNRLDELVQFDSVSYDLHLWRILTLRDPWAIYPAELANLMRVAA